MIDGAHFSNLRSLPASTLRCSLKARPASVEWSHHSGKRVNGFQHTAKIDAVGLSLCRHAAFREMTA